MNFDTQFFIVCWLLALFGLIISFWDKFFLAPSITPLMTFAIARIITSGKKQELFKNE